MEKSISEINYEELELFMPSCMMHQPNDEISISTLSNATKVFSDGISDTYITELSDGGYTFIHCDNFGCKTKEDFERLNHQCFVNMISQLDEDKLEKVRKINGVDAISNLFVFTPKKNENAQKELSSSI